MSPLNPCDIYVHVKCTQSWIQVCHLIVEHPQNSTLVESFPWLTSAFCGSLVCYISTCNGHNPLQLFMYVGRGDTKEIQAYDHYRGSMTVIKMRQQVRNHYFQMQWYINFMGKIKISMPGLHTWYFVK